MTSSAPKSTSDEPEDERDREHEQRRTETPERHERSGDRQQLEQKPPERPVVVADVVEDADRVLQRAREDGEEDDGESGEDAGGDEAACPLERDARARVRPPSRARLKPTRAAVP